MHAGLTLKGHNHNTVLLTYACWSHIQGSQSHTEGICWSCIKGVKITGHKRGVYVSGDFRKIAKWGQIEIFYCVRGGAQNHLGVNAPSRSLK